MANYYWYSTEKLTPTKISIRTDNQPKILLASSISHPVFSYHGFKAAHLFARTPKDQFPRRILCFCCRRALEQNRLKLSFLPISIGEVDTSTLYSSPNCLVTCVRQKLGNRKPASPKLIKVLPGTTKRAGRVVSFHFFGEYRVVVSCMVASNCSTNPGFSVMLWPSLGTLVRTCRSNDI